MKRLELLDYGRFLAAIFVVLFHYTVHSITSGKIDSTLYIESLTSFTRYGYLGVEFFFMISGFVIFHSSQNSTPGKFAVSRAVRLYPLYWFAVLFTGIITLNFGGDLLDVNPTQIIVNLTMLHNYFGFDHVDSVYWTLVFEIKFYVLVFLLLILGLQKQLSLFFTLWPFIMLFTLISGYDSHSYLGGYYAYFSAGALFAILQSDKSLKNILSICVSFILCLLFSLNQASLKTESIGIYFSEYIVGLIITFFFVFFLFQNSKYGQQLKLPFSRTLGSLTYPVYLIHSHFGYLFISKYGSEENRVFIYIITISIVLLISYLMHRIIEVNLSGLWHKLFMNTIYRVVTLMQGLPDKVLLAYNKQINKHT